jgi:DNA-binding MarR family transcriptional regulator
MGRRSRPRGTRVIRSPAQLGALQTPIRWTVLRALGDLGRCSVGEIAARLDWKAESLYYHVKALERAGLVRRVEQRPTGHRHEAVYEAVARRLLLDRNDRSERYLAAVRGVYRAALRTTERELLSALEGERKGKGPRRNTMHKRFAARLSPADHAKLRTLQDEIGTFDAEHEGRGLQGRLSLSCLHRAEKTHLSK